MANIKYALREVRKHPGKILPNLCADYRFGHISRIHCCEFSTST